MEFWLQSSSDICSSGRKLREKLQICISSTVMPMLGENLGGFLFFFTESSRADIWLTGLISALGGLLQQLQLV